MSALWTVEAWKSWPLPEPGVDLWEWQDGRCAWCGDADSRLVTDHCHMTGLVRGLLCSGCNTREGFGGVPEWQNWRDGDNPAWTIRHFEIYTNSLGTTPHSVQSALHYYTPVERAAWFQLVVEYLRDGRMKKWPTEAPWLDEAIERKAVLEEQMREAMSFFSLRPSRPDAEAS